MPGYKLKLNSYDLGVDIELHDALNRIRFEHPEVQGGRDHQRQEPHVLLGRQHLHARHLEPRLEGELLQVHQRDAQRHRGLERATPASSSSPRVNGTCAGGGYELALACDEIVLVDDRSSTVSLPEVPLLGVLPGTGGLTRLTDKRKVRRDLADVFCTTAEGVRADRAKEWRLVDHVAKPQEFAAGGARRARSSSPSSPTGPAAKGVEADRRSGARTGLLEVARAIKDGAHGDASPSRGRSDSVKLRDAAPTGSRCAMARELDDAILDLRTNQLDVGLWLLKTKGEPRRCSRSTRCFERARKDWFVRETHRLPAPHARAPRRVVAHDLRADRARLVLRRHAARARARRRPQLHARRRGRAARKIALSRAQLRRLPDGERPVAPAHALLAARRPSHAAARQAARRARSARASASSPPRPTTSTGTTRSASRSRSARACRPTRSPAWRRTCASPGPRPWSRASSAASRPGRTGSSSARTPSASRARSRSTARAPKPKFDWERV